MNPAPHRSLLARGVVVAAIIVAVVGSRPPATGMPTLSSPSVLADASVTESGGEVTSSLTASRVPPAVPLPRPVSGIPGGSARTPGQFSLAVAGRSAAEEAPAAISSTSTLQEGSRSIVYRGSWSQALHSGYLGDRALASRQAGASVSLRFTGTHVAWIGPTGPTRGKAMVYVNDRLVKVVDTRSGHFVTSSVLYSATYATQRQRTIRIVVAGTAGRPTVAVDAFRVRRTAATGGQPAATLAYGSGIAADGLANTQVGGTSCGCANAASSYRFRAGQSSALASLQIYVIGVGRSGYSGGDGGTLDISIQTDDATASHRPSGTVLARTAVAGSSLPAFPRIEFVDSPDLTAGRIYHVVFRNTDPEPRANFISIDSLSVETGALSPRQARYSDTDWGQLFNTGSGWRIRPEFTPILQLNYANGAKEGMGYMEAWVRDPKAISGEAKVRETFTVSGGDRTVTSASVRVRRLEGVGPLTLRLEDEGGSVIAEGTVGAGGTEMSWRTVTFPAQYQLREGDRYNLVLSADPGTTYTTFAIREGTSYGFTASLNFADGWMQYTTGDDWKDAEAWAKPSREGDLQFYLR